MGHAEFAEEFPNEPFAPWASGTIVPGITYGGYIAPGNPFAPVPVGEPSYTIGQSEDAARARAELPTVGSRYVFVAGEGFVEVRDAPYFVDPSPTDWERVSAAYEVETPEPPEIVYADIPVIDPGQDPTVTVGETASGDPVAVEQERPVAFWDTVGDIFTTTAPGAIQAYGQNQGWWGTPAAVAPQQIVLPPALNVPYPQGIDMMGSGTPPGVPPVQDAGACPPPGPRYLRYNCQTGTLSKIPRRRRRRLLTSSDLKDLAALKSIVGPSKMEGAIVQAVRR